MKHKGLKIIILINLILIVLLFYPLHMFPGIPPKEFNETTILLEYEIYGCGSLVRTVKKGGPELFNAAELEPPASGVYEVQFTSSSDEPVNHLDNAEFYSAGLASGYTYILYGQVVGTAVGAPDCCDPKPAYNETVPLFKISRWAPTRVMWEFNETILALLLLIICTFVTLIYTLVTVANHFRYKNN